MLCLLAACVQPAKQAQVVAPQVAPKAAIEKRVALTFDDIPRQRGAFFTPDERSEKLIAALREAGVDQAAFFVNPGNLEKKDRTGGEARIAAYVKAGHVIANHSFSHRHLRKGTAEEYLADIDRAARWLNDRPGYRPWFRFPYLDEGARDKVKRDAVRAGLAKRGLRNGYVTADGWDWNLEALTVKAKFEGKSMDMKALRRLYLRSQISAVEYHDAMARQTIGRSPPHVILLHETDLAALFISDLVSALRNEGWTIITADEAYADTQLAEAMPDVPYAAGTLIGSMAWEKDIDPPLSPVWLTSGMASYLFEKTVIKDSTP
ncbi:MAG: polysaccharide deacetylase family protein [Marinomonas sp.]